MIEPTSVTAGHGLDGRSELWRSVKPSAQPTLVRTQHLPPPAETARWLRKRARRAVFFLVTLCISVCHCGSMCCGVHGRIRNNVRAARTVGAHRRRFHGRPRTAPAKGALSLPRCGAGAMRRPTAGIARDGRARRRQKDERCGRPWLLLPGARAGSSCTGEGARPGRLSLNVIHPGRPGGPDPSRTPNPCARELT